MGQDDKIKALEAAITKIEKDFGKGAIMKLGDSGNHMNVETVPTGSLSLDVALGLGGVPKGRIVEIYHFDTTGIEFVMTALFVVMFMGQWEEHPDHRPALIGLMIPIVCLFVFGSQNFIIPSMALIIVCFMALKKYLQPEVKE